MSTNATTTLASTTLTASIGVSDTTIQLASLSGLVPGTSRLVIDHEVLSVVRFTGIRTGVVVGRGMGGTATTPHVAGSQVWIARGDQLYLQDPPQGLIVGVPLVQPWINVATGVAWTTQGDEIGLSAGLSWAPITTTAASGALGVRQTTTTTPS